MPTLQHLHKQGKLNQDETNYQIPNTMNHEPSTMIRIPLPQLLTLPEAANLIVYHSDNHPALS